MPNRSTFFHHLHPVTIPARESRFRYTFGLGGLSIFLFGVLVLTGALELFYYIPSIDAANQSVQTITFLVPYGWLVRGLHYWAAQALVVMVILHLLRVTFTGGYKQPRRFNWLLGLILLAAVLLLDFTGYALKWDSDIAWALLVGTNLLKSIPLIGPALYGTVVGGQEIGPDTVVRLYGWHIFGLALIAFCFIAWHIFRVRRDGGISSEQTRSNDVKSTESIDRPARISRNELVPREALAMLIATIILLALALFFPPAIGPQGNFVQPPAEATAPWIFIWVQQLLRWGDPFVMGVLLPIGLLVLLALVPYLIDRSPAGVARWFNREGRRAQLTVLILVVAIVGLTIVGARQ
jgi:quinol-cytochrome oxidoreductase complex cytochrome b subunit